MLHFLYSCKKFSVFGELTLQRITAGAVTMASNWNLRYIRDNGGVSLLPPKSKKSESLFSHSPFYSDI